MNKASPDLQMAENIQLGRWLSYFGVVFVEAEHRFCVQLLLRHHQLEHLLAISTHNQL